MAVAIVYTAWGVFKQASATLSDSARIPVADICAVGDGGARACSAAITSARADRRRRSTSTCTFRSTETSTVADGHDIAEDVERAIAEQFPQVVDVIAHLEPFDEYQAAKTERGVTMPDSPERAWPKRG